MNASDATLIQQTELLREIREELKAGRMSALAASTGGGGVGAAPSHSGAGFAARAQAMSDRVLAADFANFGWTQAFSPIYKTTAMQDVGALLGLTRAPMTMTQPEYQQLALENFGLRGHNLVGGILAPAFTSRTSALADEIFANSPRWERFGSSSSPLGAGYTRAASFALSRDISMAALSDTRMRPQDYTTVATVGMQSGQFDNVGSTNEFIGKLKELAAATADVTRTLRVSAEEASRMMGTMRSMGITDVASQRSTLMTLGAAGQVAGMTSPEMMALASGAGSTGVGLGLSGAASAVGIATLAAQMRSMTSAGVLDKYVMARGGGVGAVANEIFGAEAQFAASDAGFYSYLGRSGGAGGGFIAEASAGITANAQGGMFGMMRSARLRSQMTSRMTDSDRRAGMRSYVEQQIRLLGIDDLTSERAQDAAYEVVSGMGLGDSAALAYSAANFSMSGQQASDRARLDVIRASRLQQRKLEADEAYSYTSLGGRIRGFEAAAGKWWQGTVNYLGDKASLGIGSASGLTRWDSGIAQQVDNTARGATAQRSSAADLARAIRGYNSGGEALEIFDPFSSTGSAVGGMAGALAGGLAGAGIGAAAGVGVFSIPGLLIGGALGAVGGALGTWAGGEYGTDSTTLKGAAAKSYQNILRSTRSANLVAGQQLLKTGGLTNSAAFRSLLSESTNVGELSAADSVKWAERISKVSQDTGVSEDQVVNALMASGTKFDLAGGFKVLGGGDQKDFTDRMRTLLRGGADTGVDFTISQNASVLQRYLGAVQAGTGDEKTAKEFAQSRAALAGLGVDAKAIEGITANFRDMDKASQAGLLKAAGGMAQFGASQQFADIMGGAQGLADALIGEAEAGKDSQARSARDTFTALVNSGDRKALFDAMTGGGALSDLLSKKSAVFRAARDVGSVDIGSISARDLSSKYGVDVSFAEDIKAQVASGTLDQTDARNLMRAAILDRAGASGDEMSQQDRDKEIARHLNAAATQLTKLTETIRTMQAK